VHVCVYVGVLCVSSVCVVCCVLCQQLWVPNRSICVCTCVRVNVNMCACVQRDEQGDVNVWHACVCACVLGVRDACVCVVCKWLCVSCVCVVCWGSSTGVRVRVCVRVRVSVHVSVRAMGQTRGGGGGVRCRRPRHLRPVPFRVLPGDVVAIGRYPFHTDPWITDLLVQQLARRATNPRRFNTFGVLSVARALGPYDSSLDTV
jgi:hypothetical protein